MSRFVGTLIILTLLAAAGVVFIYSGVFNVAATEPHTALGRWILSTTMTESVRRHAREVPRPAEGVGNAAAGFVMYEDLCVTCHGAPGVERSGLGKGLRPLAPDLAEEALRWKQTEVFWIVKHGIRMTGMPAWSKSRSDEEIWDVVAFVKFLPSVSAEEYLDMRRRQQERGTSLAPTQ